jgi:hypothetical protein
VKMLVRSFSTSSRPALRAASGRPPARQPHGGRPGTDLTVHDRWSRSCHQAPGVITHGACSKGNGQAATYRPLDVAVQLAEQTGPELLESCSITTRHTGPLATHLHQLAQAQLDRILEED